MPLLAGLPFRGMVFKSIDVVVLFCKLEVRAESNM